jgi:hypothetical protein
MTEDDPGRKALLRGRFTFGLKQAIVAAAIGTAIATIAALANLS